MAKNKTASVATYLQNSVADQIVEMYQVFGVKAAKLPSSKVKDESKGEVISDTCGVILMQRPARRARHK